MEICIIPGWDKTLEALENNPLAKSLVQETGFTLPVLYNLLTRPFSPGLEINEEFDAQGHKTEDVTVETIYVDGKPLDLLLVKAYPAAAKSHPTQMTQFNKGGEVILVVDGSAQLTYAEKVTKEGIPRSSLKSVKVKKGDLIISTTTPNNWTGIDRDSFKFIYFVGNPDEPHQYREVPKTSLPVI